MVRNVRRWRRDTFGQLCKYAQVYEDEVFNFVMRYEDPAEDCNPREAARRLRAAVYRRQTTTEPILPSFLPTSVSVPEAFLLNPTPLNLHNCLPTGGFLQTAVSDAPLRTCPPLPSPHTYLWRRIRYSTNVSGCVRVADKPGIISPPPLEEPLVCGEPTGMMTFDKSQKVFFLELSLRPTKDSHL